MSFHVFGCFRPLGSDDPCLMCFESGFVGKLFIDIETQRIGGVLLDTEDYATGFGAGEADMFGQGGYDGG